MSVAEAPAGGARRSRTGGALGSAVLFLRRLRLDPGPPLTMLVLIAVTCFVFAALPRLANDVADDGLRYMVAHAPISARHVRVSETGRVTASGTEQLAAVARRADRSQEALSPSLRALVSGSAFVVRTPRYVLQSDTTLNVPAAGASTPGALPPGLVRYLTAQLQSEIRPHIRLVAGRLPAVSRVRVQTRVDNPIFLGDRISHVSWTAKVPLLEIALSRENAQLLGLRVGDRAIFVPDRNDLAFQRVPIREARPLAVRVVGTFVIKDPRAPFWFGDTTLGTPNVQRTPDLETTTIFGQALVSDDAYATMLAATRPVPLGYEYRHFLAPERLDNGDVGTLSHDVARLDARYAGAGPLERRVETGLGPVLDRFRGARSQAATLLAVGALGLLACALANIALLGALSYDRRRTETGVSRTRGASPAHVLAAQAAEGLVVAVPAGAAGWAAAVLVVDARASALSAWFVLGLVAGTVVLLVAAVAGVARRPLGPIGRDDVVLTHPSPRRLALEGLIAVVAALGVYLLRRRGLDSGNRGFDPYLAGVPVLLGLASGVVALRLYPLPIRGVVRLVRRSRGLALHLGLSRAARQPDIASAPLLVLVLALAITCFSAVMLNTLDAGQERTAWRAVGADLRIDAAEDGRLPARLVSRLESMGSVVRAYVQDAGIGSGSDPTPIIAVDVDAYERLVAHTPAAVRLPRELRESPIPGLVSALVSTNWPATGTFQVPLASGTANALTIADRPSFPGVPQDSPFAVVPLRALERAEGEPIEPNRLYARGIAASAVRRAVRATAPGARIESRADVVRNLRSSPLVDNVFRGFRIGIVLAALYAAVAVALMALITARSRSRDLALVRTMGGSPRDTLVLAAVELAPLVLTALALGIGLGLALPFLIAPGLDLAFFTGSGANPVAIPWLAPAASAAAVLLLVAVSVVLVGARTRRAGLDRVLRIGER